MSKIIFLNGCGSSGKTSIAKAIQHESPDLWLTFGVDTYLLYWHFLRFRSDAREGSLKT